MPQVATNADEYATPRQNIFFTADNQTPADGNLTGQCVTLVKWFLSQMTDVPDPFSARGDARYVGKTLVNQGHAIEIPWADRQRGDVICLEYGVYGHIYVQLSGGRAFEQNVNWPGVASKIVDGARVYASRIGSEAEAWRHDMHVYRIKSYKEGSTMDTVDRGGLETIWQGFLDRRPTDEEYKNFVGKGWAAVLFTAVTSAEFKNRYAGLVKNYNIVTYDVPKLQQQIKDLQAANPATPEMIALYNAVKAVK